MRVVVAMPEHELMRTRAQPVWPVRIALAHTIPRELAGERSYRFDAARFATHRTPTLLLLGGDSPAVFRDAVTKVNDALADSRIAVMPGQQHVAMDLAPELFLDNVRDFLVEPSGRGQ